jgi:hypothetical protein
MLVLLIILLVRWATAQDEAVPPYNPKHFFASENSGAGAAYTEFNGSDWSYHYNGSDGSDKPPSSASSGLTETALALFRQQLNTYAVLPSRTSNNYWPSIAFHFSGTSLNFGRLIGEDPAPANFNYTGNRMDTPYSSLLSATVNNVQSDVGMLAFGAGDGLTTIAFDQRDLSSQWCHATVKFPPEWAARIDQSAYSSELMRKNGWVAVSRLSGR